MALNKGFQAIMADCMTASIPSLPSERVAFVTAQQRTDAPTKTLRRQAAYALYGLGNGRFQLIAAFILGLANCSDAVEVC